MPAHGQTLNYSKDGLRIYLSGDSLAWLKFNFVSQLWIRYTDLNPGSTVQGVPQSYCFDVGIRRIRLVLSGQFSPKTFFFIQFGQNGFSYLSGRKTGAFFHDVTGEYHILGKALQVGGGLMAWNGPTRYGNSSVSSILCLETPTIEETTVDVNDQLLRKLGIFIKGTLGKFEYRFSLAKPFVVQTASSPPEPISKNSTYSTIPPHPNWQTYLRYQFFENESMLESSAVGTYLGAKKVLNIGIGANYQKDCMFHLNGADTVSTDQLLLAIDAFADLPLNKEKGDAITAYLSFCNYDFGNGFLRNGGPMNPADGVIPSLATYSGPGNAYPQLGNGHSIYFQAGYLFKKNLLGSSGTLQPFMDFTHGNYDRLADPVNVWDVGVNWLLDGKRVKFTMDYQNRPTFQSIAGAKPIAYSHKGQWVLAFQLAL